MQKYIPSQIEPKWQKKWRENQLYQTDLLDTKNKYYVLVELPYTSGDLHIGHWFTFTMGDILARFKRRQGFNVLFPNGFDTFGLPAENAAIKNDMHPKDWTYANIGRMREQFETMGVSIDWKKTAITCESEYYKWNQWIFLKMLERGIAYKGKAISNWCPSCKTVLANENVEDGKCWRCGTEVVQKEVDQWFLKLLAYAERLLWKEAEGAEHSRSIDWPKPLRASQNSWIGKSQGMVIKFDNIEIFGTRQDTIFGVTFIVISPENLLLDKLVVPEQKLAVQEYIQQAKKKSELERKENKEKTGVFTGSYVKNPMNGEEVPVWVADYVLMGYGTGAVMGVPGHDQRDFEFAKKYNLDVKQVISPIPISHPTISHPRGVTKENAYEGEGVMVNSGEYDGMPSNEAREKISDYLEQHHLGERKTNYHLHDWSISRQRYWGTPIPIVYCDKCGTVPVPEKDLPVELPYDVDYTPQGKPPLATAEDWVKVKCPKCAGMALREVETMDGFVDNSWYFYRYLDHKNVNEIFERNVVQDWIPVDIYIGGAEHTVGHTLYSRFFTKFFHDLGLISFDEYALKRVHHGVILGPDGARMSKSRGNVVNPDEEVKNYGADAIRLYLMFLGPFDIVTPWNPGGIMGVYHFLQRVWGLQEKLKVNPSTTLRVNGEPFGSELRAELQSRTIKSEKLKVEDLRIMHKTIKKVTEDIEEIKFNTAIAALMEWLNHLSKKEEVSKEEYRTLLLLLAPFAPHITEQLWQLIGGKYSIHQHFFPKFDEKYLEEDEVSVVVQINGKVRDVLLIQKDILNNKEVIEKMAKESAKVKKFLEGKSVEKTVYIPGKIISFAT